MSAPFRTPDAAEIARKREAWLEDVREHAPRYVGTFRRAYSGKSLRAAVNAGCCECMGLSAAEVKKCTAPACPFWPYRKGRKRT